MKRTVSLIFSLLLVTSLIACAPVRTEYFQPTSVGNYSPITCGGGPSNKITVNISDNVAVQVYAQVVENKKLSLNISYDVPENHIIKLKVNEFKIITKNKSDIIKVNNFRAMKANYPKGSTVQSRVIVKQPKDALEGESYFHKTIWHKTLFHRSYNVNFEKYDIKADKEGFILEPPSLLINNILTPSPKIHFKRESGIFIYAINC